MFQEIQRNKQTSEKTVYFKVKITYFSRSQRNSTKFRRFKQTSEKFCKLQRRTTGNLEALEAVVNLRETAEEKKIIEFVKKFGHYYKVYLRFENFRVFKLTSKHFRKA